MDINYYGPVVLTRAILPSFLQRKKGTIVALSSVQGLFGVPYRSPYNAPKHALVGYYDSLISELYDYKDIHVMVVYPGYVQ